MAGMAISSPTTARTIRVVREVDGARGAAVGGVLAGMTILLDRG